MSSEFAEFLFSFACNKLETSPQLDLRQQLLHSNLIRHILLVHQPTSTSVSSDHSSHSHQEAHQQQHPLPMEETTPTTTTATSSSSLVEQSPQPPSLSSSSSPSVWSPYSFDDELDRIQLADQQQLQLDSDVVMEEQDELDQQPSSSSSSSLSSGNIINSNNPFDLSSSSSPMIFDDSYYNYFYQPNPYQQHHHQHHLQQQQVLQLRQIQLQYPLQQHQQQMLDEDQEYLYEASQAQEDWLDAVLEDLIEDDQDNDDDDDEDVSSPEYDDSDDSVVGNYDRDTFGDDVERRQQQLSEPRQSFLSLHHRLLPFGPDNEKGSTLSLSAIGTTTVTTQTITPSTTSSTAIGGAAATTPPLTPCLSPSSSPSTSTQTANAHTTTATTTGAAATAITSTSASRFLARGDISDHDPTHHPHNNNNNNNTSSHHVSRRLIDIDEAYYHPCPPCLGFHCSSPSRTSSSSSSASPPSSFRVEDSLREKRFAQLTQELTSTYLFQQQRQQQHQGTGPTMVFEHDQPSLSAAPPLLKTKDPLSFRAPSSTTSSFSRLSLRSSSWLEPSSSGCD